VTNAYLGEIFGIFILKQKALSVTFDRAQR
jgi:hypothetical protein